MGTCRHCARQGKTISRTIGFCAECIRGHFDALWPHIKEVHDHSRKAYDLPLDPPRSKEGVSCPLCMHGCRIPEGGRGFCGLRRCEHGRIKGGRPHEGNLAFYYDLLPTNCVASFVCPAGMGAGYPRYAVSNGPEYGKRNLAVFYQACSFNCLFCQNFHFKGETFSTDRITAGQLARAVDETTTCICYFGGDPTPQVLHAIKAARLSLERATHRTPRICWETNGSAQGPVLTRMADLSMKSGGCIKVDLKAWDEKIHYALCGVTNKQVLANIKALSTLVHQRPVPPFLIVSTLLVPGYVDELEVGAIARFIADLNPEIPYSLLGFYPHFYLRDLPTTSRDHALRCKEIAQEKGLRHVNVGNIHLLGDDY